MYDGRNGTIGGSQCIRKIKRLAEPAEWLTNRGYPFLFFFIFLF
jgi:hypothetical protein